MKDIPRLLTYKENSNLNLFILFEHYVPSDKRTFSAMSRPSGRVYLYSLNTMYLQTNIPSVPCLDHRDVFIYTL